MQSRLGLYWKRRLLCIYSRNLYAAALNFIVMARIWRYGKIHGTRINFPRAEVSQLRKILRQNGYNNRKPAFSRRHPAFFILSINQSIS